MILIQVFSICFGHAQSIQVKYEYLPNPNNLSESISIPAELYVNDTITTFAFLLRNKKEQSIIRNDSTIIKSGPAKSNKHLVSDKRKKHIYLQEESWFGQRLVIIDSIEHNWKVLASNPKTILGFTCYAAKTNFRGRNYIAWYAPDIPITYGPWKFNGLPGLILEAYTDDHKYQFRAVSYTNKPSTKTINKWLKWYEYIVNHKKLNRSKYVKMVYQNNLLYEKNMSTDAQGITLNKSRVIHIEKDLSYNSDK